MRGAIRKQIRWVCFIYTFWGGCKIKNSLLGLATPSWYRCKSLQASAPVLSESDMSWRQRKFQAEAPAASHSKPPSKRSSVRPLHSSLSLKRSHYPEYRWEGESRQRTRERPGLVESFASSCLSLSAHILMDCYVNTGRTKCFNHLLFPWKGQRWIHTTALAPFWVKY